MSVLIHQHWEASKQRQPELDCCSESPPGSTTAVTDLASLFCCQGKASSVSVIPTSAWKPSEHSLCYSKLWNFTSIKIWTRDMGLYSQMAMWYKSPIKCHNEYKLIWGNKLVDENLGGSQTSLELRYSSFVRAHSNSGIACFVSLTSLLLILSQLLLYFSLSPICTFSLYVSQWACHTIKWKMGT